jgi:hypothetical protein
MATNRAICTIIAKNYLAAARTLCQTYQHLHPEDRCFVLVVDEHRGFIDPAKEDFELVGVEELEIPDFYPSFAFKYNVTELSTAVKPYLLELLLRQRGIDKLLYLDPDIMVLQKLDRLYEVLDRFDIVLTPHLDADYPDDGMYPNDSSIMQAGMFNLGFIGVNSSKNANDFLKWWKGKLYSKCLVDLEAGYFVDQKFLDLAVLFYNGIHIEKDTGYNVAVYNLHSRRLSFEDGVWLCNGMPLYFYHFTGFDYSDNNTLSKYYQHNGNPRHNFNNRPELVPLYKQYRDRIRANGQDVASQWRYTYGYFDAGEPILEPFRKWYRDSEQVQTRCADPFVLESFIRHFPECKPFMVKALFEKCYHAMMAGDYRTGAVHLKQVYAYDRSLLLDRSTRGYMKWVASLWLKDQARRLLTRPSTSVESDQDNRQHAD